MLYIGADHGGFELKEKLKLWLTGQGVDFEDMGAHALVPDDDYPVYAKLVAEKVSADPEQDLGILLCRSGQGVAITANKFAEVRAAVVWNEKEARASKNDDHANVLCLPSDYVDEALAHEIVSAWLETPFSLEERHVRRVGMMERG